MARKKLIKVTFPDGTVICLSSRTETMLSVLRKIGENISVPLKSGPVKY